MAKVRVYELAKEFGVESKVVMAKLQDMGEFVRSASSTIEAPVVRKLTEAFGKSSGKSSGSQAPKAAPGRPAAPGPRPGGPRPPAPGGEGARPAAPRPGPRPAPAPVQPAPQAPVQRAPQAPVPPAPQTPVSAPRLAPAPRPAAGALGALGALGTFGTCGTLGGAGGRIRFRHRPAWSADPASRSSSGPPRGWLRPAFRRAAAHRPAAREQPVQLDQHRHGLGQAGSPARSASGRSR